MKTFTEDLLTDDICKNKHGGNPQSEAANLKVDKENDRTYVLRFIREHKTGYLKQIARVMGKQKNEISGRFTELKADNLIIETGERAEGCSIYKIRDVWELSL